MRQLRISASLAAALVAVGVAAACGSSPAVPSGAVSGATPAPPATSAASASSPASPSQAPAPPPASPGAPGLVVFDGCSLVMDTGLDEAGMMPSQVMALLPAGLEALNLGVPGQTTQMMQADAAAEVDPLAEGRRGPVLVVWEGTNDLTYGSDPRSPSRPRTCACSHTAAHGSGPATRS